MDKIEYVLKRAAQRGCDESTIIGDDEGTQLLKSDLERIAFDSSQALNAVILEEVLAIVPSNAEQNFYRNKLGELFCSTCNDEVFGSICGCTYQNDILDSIRTALHNKYSTK